MSNSSAWKKFERFVMALKEGLAAYQLVGGVKDHQG